MQLIRFTLRRDRARLPVWVLAIGLTVLGSVASFGRTYPTPADRQARAEALDSAAARLFVGPGYGTDAYTFGAMAANEMLPAASIAVALMSVFLVVRHTRAEEEAGRAEMVRATAVGRNATAASALGVVAGANILLVAILAAGLPASLDGLSATGSLAFAASLAGVGLVFAGVAVLVCQFTASARIALGIASVVVGIAYLVRAVGDMGESVLPWVSPFGWATELRAYVGERWWPLAASALTTGLLIAAAVRVNALRDLGAGIIAGRPGASTAARRLGSPFGLALRLQRASLLAWSVCLFIVGVLYGGIAEDAGTLYQDIDALHGYLTRIGAADPVGQFLALSAFVSALIAAGSAIQAASRLRTEEAAQRAESVLAARVGRERWFLSHVAIALVGSAVVLLMLGLGLGLAGSISAEDPGELPRLIAASLAYAPAVWVFVGLASALFGLAPRLVGAAWGVLGALAFVGFLGPLLRLPEWVFDLSPLEHVPRLPVEEFSVVPESILTVIAGALVGLGLVAFGRRDVAGA